MPRRIVLHRKHIKNANHFHLRVFRLRIDVVETTGIDKEIFVYRQHPVDPTTNERPLPDFMTVASPVDMAEYPVNEPSETTALPFFRLSYVELDVRSVRAFEEVWTAIQSQVCRLRAAMDKADVLEFAEEVVCEPPDELPVSDSSMASESSING